MVRERAVAAMMAMIRADLDLLGVHHDVFFSERSLQSGGIDRVAEAIAALAEKGLIYRGTLPPPKGQVPEDWEDREQTLFRSTAFGDDIDRPLLKSDGSYTYFASDIAYHYDKYLRGFRQMIDVLGADHGGYPKRMKAAVTAMSGGEATLDILFCQLVKLFRAGEPVVMSKRSGDLVTLREVVEEVGARLGALHDALPQGRRAARFRLPGGAGAVEGQSGLLRAVRACAHRLGAAAGGRGGAEDRARSRLRLRRRTFCSSTMRASARSSAPWRIGREYWRLRRASREPHRVAFYLHELASAFHAHWNKGKELPQLRFIRPDDIALSRARLGLVTAVGCVLKCGLQVLGVEAPDEMY